MGDCLRIKAFRGRRAYAAAEQKSRQETIEEMKIPLRHQKSSKQSNGRDAPGQKENKSLKTVLKFEFGWKHWCHRAETFKQKKKGSGGGTRVLEVPKVASVDVCLELAKELFFPQGISPKGAG